MKTTENPTQKINPAINILACLNFWTTKSSNSFRQSFNYDLYIRVLEAKQRLINIEQSKIVNNFL